MKQLHNFLMEKHAWYVRWHQNPNHGKNHWLLFIIINALIFSLLLNHIKVVIQANELQNKLLQSTEEVRGNSVAAQIKAKELRGGQYRQTELFIKGKSRASIKAPHAILALGNRGRDMRQAKDDMVKIDLPLPDGKTVKLKMFLVEDNTKVLTSSSTNPVVSSALSYRGVIEGKEQQSLASLTISSDGKKLFGFVKHGSRLYVIDELQKSDMTAEDTAQNANIIFDLTENKDPVIFEGDQLIAPPISQTDSREKITTALMNYFLPTAEARPGDSVKWYWEADYDIYLSKGSVQAVSDYVRGVFNQAQTIYANDGIKIELKTLFIWASQDPYVGPSTGNYLTQFKTYRTTWDGDLAHLIGFAGNGGVAYVNGIGMCEYGMGQVTAQTAYSGAYSTYAAYPSYSWTVNVVTHEMGHQLSSNHTHDCVWNGNGTKIDDCGGSRGYSGGTCLPQPDPILPVGGGTVMSYCHLTSAGINFLNGFGSQPRDKIKNAIDNSTCLTPPTNSSDSTLPTVSLTYPLSGTTVFGSINVSASATDNIGVTKVDFYRGSTLISTDTTAPYAVAWDTTTLANGTHSLTARAYDAAGNTKTSTAVSVTVSNTVNNVSVSITSPLSGTTISGIVSIITSTLGIIDHVDFYRGTSLIGADATSPYSISWDSKSVADGSYSLSAKAYTSAGASTTSSPVSVTIKNITTPTPDTTQPTVTLTGPTGTISGTVPVTANATDNIGVTKVDFYRGSTLISTDTTAPYAVSWNTTALANGTYSLTAKAFDVAGNTKTSVAVSVTVSNVSNKAPVVSAGSDQTVYLPSLSVNIAGSATDDGLPNPPATLTTTWTKVSGPGTVAFSSQLASTTATFSVSGTYVLRLRATDGTLATTDDVSVSIISQPTGSTFLDDFNRANGSLVSPWSVISGAFNIVSNELKTGTGSGYQIATLPSSANASTQQIGGSFAITSSSQSSKLGVVLRVQNASNYYACYRINGGTSTRRIVKVVNSVETVLGQSSIGNPSVGVYFPISCSISGTTITMKQGTTTILTVNDGTFTSGPVGILSGINAATNTSEKIDNVSAGW